MVGKMLQIGLVVLLSLRRCDLAFSEPGINWQLATRSAGWAGRADHASVEYEGKIWVLGGHNSFVRPSRYGDVWYSVNGITWTRATRWAPWQGRYNHASVVHDGKIWVLGGNGEKLKNDVWSSEDGIHWRKVRAAAPWSARENHTSVVHNGRIWVLGGSSGKPHNDVWHSSDGIEWTQALASAPWDVRYGHSSVVHDGKIWVLGGIDWKKEESVFYRDVWSSADGVHWTCVTERAPWFAHSGHTTVSHDGRIWVFGGFSWSRNVREAGFRKEIWASPDGSNWKLITDGPSWNCRAGHTAVAHRNKIWILGGSYIPPEQAFATYMNDVWHSAEPLTQ